MTPMMPMIPKSPSPVPLSVISWSTHTSAHCEGVALSGRRDVGVEL